MFYIPDHPNDELHIAEAEIVGIRVFPYRNPTVADEPLDFRPIPALRDMDVPDGLCHRHLGIHCRWGADSRQHILVPDRGSCKGQRFINGVAALFGCLGWVCRL